MSTKSDLHEIDVAEVINKHFQASHGWTGWKAVASTKGVKYSDVEIFNSRGHSKAWVEVKMNHDDNMFNARPSFIGGKFVFSDEDPAGAAARESEGGPLLKQSDIKKEMLRRLNAPNSLGRRFIKALKAYLDRDNITILTAKPGTIFKVTDRTDVSAKSYAGRLANANKETKGGRGQSKWSIVSRTDDVVSWYEFKDYFQSTGKNQFFAEFIKQGGDITEEARIHYNEGKRQPAHYIQTGPDFYLMGKTDPLGLNQLKLNSRQKKIPHWGATGEFRVRMALGLTTGGRTEIMPQLKAKSVTESSSYGCDPRVFRKVGLKYLTTMNPFQPLTDKNPHLFPK